MAGPGRRYQVEFRGVESYHDKIQRLKLPNGEERLGFLSTVLTKNQGSYTRRLRSLATNRLVNGIEENEKPPKGSPVPAIGPSAPVTQQMGAHSLSPNASNFLSFTDKLDIAAMFAGANMPTSENSKMTSGFLAVKIDARRIFANVVSPLSHEKEYLVPLGIFPDEIISYVETTPNAEVDRAKFIEQVKAKTGIDAAQYEITPQAYKVLGHNFLRTAISGTKASQATICQGMF